MRHVRARRPQASPCRSVEGEEPATPPLHHGGLRSQAATILVIIVRTGRTVTRWMRRYVAVASVLLSGAAWGQLPERPRTGKPPAEPAPSGAVTPESESLGRAVAIQVRPDQVGYFQSVIENTDAALQLSRDLQRLGPAAGNIATVNALSLQLRDVLDDIEHYNRRLLASFSKAQETELKGLTKRLQKSYSYVVRDSRTVQQLMEPGKVNPKQLATGAANLEKALSDFRTDQIRLGREMGIQSK